MPNQNCVDQMCPQLCCNQNGYCPIPLSNDPSENTCYYSYSQTEQFNPAVSIPIIVIGSLTFVALVIVIVVYWRGKNKKRGPPSSTMGGQTDGNQVLYVQGIPSVGISVQNIVYSQLNENILQQNHIDNMHLQGHLVSEQQETAIEGPHFEKKATLNSYNTAETASNAKDQDHPPEDTQK